MAARAVRPLRYLALLALAVLSSCFIPTASQPLESTATTPLVVDEDGGRPSAEERLLGRACTYTVKVKTSCASRARSMDAVSLAFGDAYRDEVYVAQLTPPRTGFQRCATDTFRVSGPCGYGVCYLYLRRRTGGGGWTPEWVRVYEPTSSTPSTFYYGDALPAGVWYGINRCVRRPAPSVAAAALSSM
jgi:hypothetical protein